MKFFMQFGKKSKAPIDHLKPIPTPILTERDLRRCVCCTPSRRTIITGVDMYGMPEFLCANSGIRFKWAKCRGKGSTYIASTGILK